MELHALVWAEVPGDGAERARARARRRVHPDALAAAARDPALAGLAAVLAAPWPPLELTDNSPPGGAFALADPWRVAAAAALALAGPAEWATLGDEGLRSLWRRGLQSKRLLVVAGAPAGHADLGARIADQYLLERGRPWPTDLSLAEHAARLPAAGYHGLLLALDLTGWHGPDLAVEVDRAGRGLPLWLAWCRGAPSAAPNPPGRERNLAFTHRGRLLQGRIVPAATKSRLRPGEDFLVVEGPPPGGPRDRRIIYWPRGPEDDDRAAIPLVEAALAGESGP